MKKVLGILIAILLILMAIVFWYLYKAAFSANVDTGGAPIYFHVHSDWGSEEVRKALIEQGLLIDTVSFDMVADKKNYSANVRPGRYLLEDKLSNDGLIDLLRSGVQEPVQLTFNNVKDLTDLAGKLAKNIEPDSTEMVEALMKKETIAHYGFEPHTFVAMFIPNTYEVYWNWTAEKIIERMATEYKAFWSDSRRARAEELNMDPIEITTLASIVKAETNLAEERARIAGVYMNRLRIGMPLQADPTLLFGLKDKNIRRVLNEHKKIDSPYNTYIHLGLPPGPINMPESPYLDAVLNYEKHDYLYFCADEELSGRSNFSKTYAQHQVYARRYRQALNKRGIYK